MYIWDQHTFVQNCLNWYKEVDLDAGNPEDGKWHKAHYPLPKSLGGEDWVWLLREHHAVQGTLQSLELNHCCLGGWEKQYLIGTWEYLLPVFISACSMRGRINMQKLHAARDEHNRSLFGLLAADRLNKEKDDLGRSINAIKGGKASRKSGRGALCRTWEQMSEDGKKGGAIAKQLKIGIFAPGQQSKGGSLTAKQKWQCTVTGKISAPGPLTGWQKARDIDVSNRIRRFDLEN